MINLDIVKKIREQMKYNFILNGGLQMYDYKISDDTTKEIVKISNEQKKKKQVDELLSKIKSVNAQFSINSDNAPSVPEKISLDKLTFEGKSEDEIKKEAQTELSDYKNKSINQIENENKLKQDKLNESKNILKTSATEQKETLSGYYDDAKENASNEALKRGLARSSIIINQLDAFDNGQIKDYKKIDEDLTGKIQTINFELSGLGGELEKALNDFDISYAVDLQNKINTLTTDLKSKEQEVIKYNNEIALKEAEYNKKVQELENDLANADWEKGVDLSDIYGKYGANIVSKIINDNLYKETKNYLSSLSKEDALEILNDESVKAYLGSSYQTLLKEFGG